ncbi:sensor domain-containing diguanylate cyclase [Paenibacillus sp. N3.4]|uniref:sensor domain-containing diguanylate cyclase n=1 Tax=Paenibacillus sp. N3.4 TaxID=2603222 RepID=UPI0011C75F8E|nr:sensor domain-containing diguanylate cyclase [Paenibacillus sp. N3.4]TXK84813.1 diguanylate cyclase [Paenibacillus sp. N3.4]
MKTLKSAPRIRLVHFIALLVFVSVMVISTIQIVAAYEAERNSLYETTLERNYDSAQKMGMTMNTLFASMQHSLQVTSDHLVSNMNNRNLLQEQLDMVTSSNNYFNSEFVLDEQAIVQAVSPISVGLVGKKLTSKQALDAQALQQPTISKPYEGSTKRLILLMSHPIFSAAGKYLGYLGGTIYLQESNVLSDIFGSNQVSSSGSYFYVVDGAGNIIYHPAHDRLGQNASTNPIVNKLRNGESGKEKIINTQGVAMLAGYSYVAQNGWGVVVQTPVQEVEEKSIQLIKSVLFYSFPFLLLMLIAAIWLGKKLSEPFASLARTAQSILKGKQVADIPKIKMNNYEAYQLSETILLTIDTLQKRANDYATEAQTDALTGLANRRSRDMLMTGWIEKGTPFSLIALDIDCFKQVNDTYGHDVGDDVLKFLGETLLSLAGEEVFCSRYGGEEFMLLLPHVTKENAYLHAEKVRLKLEATPSPTGKPITVSLGVSSYTAQGMTAHEALSQADQALYTAKGNGRNCTVMYG